MNEPRGYGFNPQQLIRLRQERGFSQRQLAEASGLARMGIVRYEQGTSEPRMESVQSIARELGVDPKVFFDWSSTEGPSTESAPKAESALKVLSISPPPVAAASPLAPPDPRAGAGARRDSYLYRLEGTNLKRQRRLSGL